MLIFALANVTRRKIYSDETVFKNAIKKVFFIMYEERAIWSFGKYNQTAII